VSSGVPTSPASASLSSAIARGVTRCALIVEGRRQRSPDIAIRRQALPTAPQRTKAPPCMRWRGLARRGSEGRSLGGRFPGVPIARRPVARPAACCQAATGLDTRPGSGLPAPPRFRGSPPDRYPRSVVRAFLLPRPKLAQALHASDLRNLWPSTGHDAVIPCIPALVHGFIHIVVHRYRRMQALPARAVTHR
jgi:hypothetical protein